MSTSTSCAPSPRPEPGPASEPQGRARRSRGARPARSSSARPCASCSAWWPSGPRPRPRPIESRVANDAKVDTEYAKTRQGLVEKYVTLDREARSADEQRRRDDHRRRDGGRGEGQGRVRRGQPADRQPSSTLSARRPRTNTIGPGATPRASSTPASARRPPSIPRRCKPLSDAVEVADGFRDRLATLAAEYAQVQAQSRAARPRLASRTRNSTDPVDELFNRLGRMEPPLKILEGLIIPKTMKGAREAWVFIVPASRLRGHRPRAGTAEPPASPAWPSPGWRSAACCAPGSSSSPRPSSSGSTTRSCSRWPTPTA